MQNKNLEDLTELDIQGKWIFTKGKCVFVIPIGKPWIIELRGKDSRGNYDIDAFKKKANEYYSPPTGADSYVIGQGTSYVETELSVRPIQAYKIVGIDRPITDIYKLLRKISLSLLQ